MRFPRIYTTVEIAQMIARNSVRPYSTIQTWAIMNEYWVNWIKFLLKIMGFILVRLYNLIVSFSLIVSFMEKFPQHFQDSCPPFLTLPGSGEEDLLPVRLYCQLQQFVPKMTNLVSLSARVSSYQLHLFRWSGKQPWTRKEKRGEGEEMKEEKTSEPRLVSPRTESFIPGEFQTLDIGQDSLECGEFPVEE